LLSSITICTIGFNTKTLYHGRNNIKKHKINTIHSLTDGAEPFSRSRQMCSHSRISQHFMEPEGILPCCDVGCDVTAFAAPMFPISIFPISLTWCARIFPPSFSPHSGPTRA
jgi:hypothetical protein